MTPQSQLQNDFIKRASVQLSRKMWAVTDQTEAEKEQICMLPGWKSPLIVGGPAAAVKRADSAPEPRDLCAPGLAARGSEPAQDQRAGTISRKSVTHTKTPAS